MLNFIWCFFIIVSVIFSIINGSFVDVNNSIFLSIQTTVELCIKLLGVMCFWNGVINIITNTSIQDKLKKLIKPINNFLFPKLSKESKAYRFISVNMVTNLLGIGNAATPAGLQAMEELEKENKSEKELSDDMIIFLAINTASLQLIPTNVIAIRASLNSENPGGIILGVWFCSIITFLTIIFLAKLYLCFRKRKNA